MSSERETPLEELAKWLYDEAGKRMVQAASRRGMAGDKNLTRAQLKQAKDSAEKMFGRKLDLVSTDPKDHKASCDMQIRIAEKLEAEAKRLSDWAGWVIALQLAVTTEHTALVGALAELDRRKS